MSKNIVICCDGTGNEFGAANSNVVKLYAALQRDPERQVAYYHPGIGTAGEMDRPSPVGRIKKKIRLLLGNAFGLGLFSNLARAYAFLMDNYHPGDRIFIFGFSRGAYTAKALTALIYQFGILEKGNNILIEYAVALFTRPSTKNFKIAKAFQATFGQDVKIHFVGLWDAVSSVGWIYDPLHLPYTFQNPDIITGRHALAIDERRCFFRPNIWGEAKPGQDIKQVWFPGVHSDIGGGYAEFESGLAKISLEWMMEEAETAGLLFNQEERAKILGGSPEFIAPSFRGQLHRSLSAIWWIAEYLPKRFWDARVTPPKNRYYWPRGRYRTIPENSILHESVELRKAAADLKYTPTNLPQNYTIEREGRAK